VGLLNSQRARHRLRGVGFVTLVEIAGAASSFETSRNDSCPALVDVFLGYGESEYLRSKLLVLLGVMVI